jgi:hypothetical protein
MKRFIFILFIILNAEAKADCDSDIFNIFNGDSAYYTKEQILKKQRKVDAASIWQKRLEEANVLVLKSELLSVDEIILLKKVSNQLMSEGEEDQALIFLERIKKEDKRNPYLTQNERDIVNKRIAINPLIENDFKRIDPKLVLLIKTRRFLELAKESNPLSLGRLVTNGALDANTKVFYLNFIYNRSTFTLLYKMKKNGQVYIVGVGSAENFYNNKAMINRIIAAMEVE